MSAFLTTKEVSAKIKAATGYNSKQVSVSKSSSTRYITCTVRDAAVNLKKLKDAVSEANTWQMSMDDCVSGQSIHITTTKEVDAAHAAPFIAEITREIVKAEELRDGQGNKLSNGKFLWKDRGGDLYIGTMNNDRGHYIRTGNDWTIPALALQMARVGA